MPSKRVAPAAASSLHAAGLAPSGPLLPHVRHHRSAVLPAGDPGHHHPWPRQGRVLRHRHDLDAADRAGDPAVAGRRDRAADPDRAGRDLGLGLPPRIRHLEPEGAAASAARSASARLAPRPHISTTRMCGSWSGTIGVAFVLYTWFGRVPAEPKKPRAAAGVFWGAMTRHHLDAGAGRRAAVPDVHAAAEARQDDAGRHHADLLRGAELDEARAYSALGQFTRRRPG